MRAIFLLTFLVLGVGVMGLPEAVDGSGEAMKVHDLMPRVYGPKLEPSNFTSMDFSDMMPYLIGTAALAGFGVLFFLISTFGGGGFCCGRYCCNKCGGRAAKEGGYTESQIWKPFAALTICSLLVIGSVTVIWIYSAETHNQITSEDPKYLWGDVDATMSDTISRLETINITLTGLPARAGQFQNFLALNVLQMQLIGLESTQLATILSSMASEIYVNRTFTVPPRSINATGLVSTATWTCSNCAPVHNQLLSTLVTLQAYATVITPTLNALATVQANTATGRSRLTNITSDSANQVLDLRRLIQSTHESMRSERERYMPYENARYGTLIALMCLPLLGFIFVLADGVTKKGGFFCTTAILSWLVLTLFALLLAVYLPLTSTAADGCVVLNYAETNLANLTTETIDDIAHQCLTNSSAATALNLTGEVTALQQQYSAGNDFTTYIAQMDLSTLTASMLASQASLATLSLQGSFGVVDADIDTNIASLNAVVAQYLVPPVVYTRATVATVDDAAPGANSTQRDQVLTYKYTALQLVDSEVLIGSFLLQVAANGTTAGSLYTTLATTVVTAQTTLSMIPGLMLQMFNGLNNILIETFYCGWIGDHYREIKRDLCDSLVLELGLTTLGLFATIVFLTPVTILSVIMCKRITNPQLLELKGGGDVMLDTFKYDELGNIVAINYPNATPPTQFVR